MSDPLSTVLNDLIAKEIERRLREEGAQGNYDAGFAAGREAGHAECATQVAAELRQLANTLTKNSPTPLEPQVAAPTSSPPTESSQPREPKSLPERKQRIRDYLASHPGARYRALSKDLGQYVATAVYALEKSGEVVKDEDRGFWLKSNGAPQQHAQDDPNRRRSTG